MVLSDGVVLIDLKANGQFVHPPDSFSVLSRFLNSRISSFIPGADGLKTIDFIFTGACSSSPFWLQVGMLRTRFKSEIIGAGNNRGKLWKKERRAFFMLVL